MKKDKGLFSDHNIEDFVFTRMKRDNNIGGVSIEMEQGGDRVGHVNKVIGYGKRVIVKKRKPYHHHHRRIHNKKTVPNKVPKALQELFV